MMFLKTFFVSITFFMFGCQKSKNFEVVLAFENDSSELVAFDLFADSLLLKKVDVPKKVNSNSISFSTINFSKNKEEYRLIVKIQGQLDTAFAIINSNVNYDNKFIVVHYINKFIDTVIINKKFYIHILNREDLKVF